jgi:hypothetical protein
MRFGASHRGEEAAMTGACLSVNSITSTSNLSGWNSLFLNGQTFRSPPFGCCLVFQGKAPQLVFGVAVAVTIVPGIAKKNLQ